MQNRITKLYSCPDCDNSTNGQSCKCGWKKPKKIISKSTDYVGIPALTPEEREKSLQSMHLSFKKLLREKPGALGNTEFSRKLLAEIRDEKQETKQEEKSDDKDEKIGENGIRQNGRWHEYDDIPF